MDSSKCSHKFGDEIRCPTGMGKSSNESALPLDVHCGS